MTSFSSLLSTIGANPQAPNITTSSAQSSAARASPSKLARQPNLTSGDRFKLTPNNVVTGAKRKSEEPESTQNAKAIKTESGRPTTTPNSRFQLSSKAKPAASTHQRPVTASSSSPNPQKTPSRQSSRPEAAASRPASSNGATPKPKGFLSMLEQAKAAQEAAKAANAGGIKHKPVEKLNKKERLRMMEEHKARQKSAKMAPDRPEGGSSRNIPSGVAKPGLSTKRPAEPLAYQGTMKKAAAAPLAYQGTMRREPLGGAKEKSKQRGMGQDKYGGYASWSDLSDAEDEDQDEDAYDSDEDMEAGFDDVGIEEEMALRAARKEDQEASLEEERLKAEKAQRKRKLHDLSRKAAAGKRF